MVFSPSLLTSPFLSVLMALKENAFNTSGLFLRFPHVLHQRHSTKYIRTSEAQLPITNV